MHTRLRDILVLFLSLAVAYFRHPKTLSNGELGFIGTVFEYDRIDPATAGLRTEVTSPGVDKSVLKVRVRVLI